MPFRPPLRPTRAHARRGLAAALVVTCGAAVLLLGTGQIQRAAAQTTVVTLGNAGSFAVLTGSTGSNVTGTGTSTVSGDVGGTQVSGLNGQVTGTIQTGDDNLAQARADLATADDAAASSPVTNQVSTVGGTLTPGVYGVTGPIDISGTVTLDAGGDPNATFIIKTGTTFTARPDVKVTLANEAQACNVVWQAGGSATVAGTVVGTILGRGGIAVQTSAQVDGQLLARSGAVTLDTATVRRPSCTTASPATGSGAGTSTSSSGTTGGGTTGSATTSSATTSSATTSSGTTASSSCDPNYSGCVPIASDVDCEGGGGDGPVYVKGPVTIIGNDIYDLDTGGQSGVGCEENSSSSTGSGTTSNGTNSTTGSAGSGYTGAGGSGWAPGSGQAGGAGGSASGGNGGTATGGGGGTATAGAGGNTTGGAGGTGGNGGTAGTGNIVLMVPILSPNSTAESGSARGGDASGGNSGSGGAGGSATAGAGGSGTGAAGGAGGEAGAGGDVTNRDNVTKEYDD